MRHCRSGFVVAVIAACLLLPARGQQTRPSAEFEKLLSESDRNPSLIAEVPGRLTKDEAVRLLGELIFSQNPGTHEIARNVLLTIPGWWEPIGKRLEQSVAQWKAGQVPRRTRDRTGEAREILRDNEAAGKARVQARYWFFVLGKIPRRESAILAAQQLHAQGEIIRMEDYDIVPLAGEASGVLEQLKASGIVIPGMPYRVLPEVQYRWWEANKDGFKLPVVAATVKDPSSQE